MAREFKPVRSFVLLGVAALIACSVAVFYTHRAAHGRTAEERAAYDIGEKAGEQPPRDAKLPTDAELNMIAQKYFEHQGSGDELGKSFASRRPGGSEAGFRKGVHRRVQEDARSPVNVPVTLCYHSSKRIS